MKQVLLSLLFCSSALAGSFDFNVMYGTNGGPHIVGTNAQAAISALVTAGTVGPQGPAGPQGPQGPAGANGTNGVNGINGTNGLDGAQGQIGPQGPAGANGTNGATGPQGPAGIPFPLTSDANAGGFSLTNLNSLQATGSVSAPLLNATAGQLQLGTLRLQDAGMAGIFQVNGPFVAQKFTGNGAGLTNISDSALSTNIPVMTNGKLPAVDGSQLTNLPVAVLPIFGGQINGHTISTRYDWLQGFGSPNLSAVFRVRFSRDCILSNLCAFSNYNSGSNYTPGDGTNWTFIVEVNASESALAVTIPTGQTSVTNTSNSVTVHAGDMVEMKIVSNSAGGGMWCWSLAEVPLGNH